jgi:hypothetical protein
VENLRVQRFPRTKKDEEGRLNSYGRTLVTKAGEDRVKHERGTLEELRFLEHNAALSLCRNRSRRVLENAVEVGSS